MFNKTMAALSTAGLGLALMMATAVPAGASELKSSHHKSTNHPSSTNSSHGTSPNSKLCQLVKSNVAEGERVSAAVQQAITENNWPAAQKTLKAVFGQEDKLESEMLNAIHSAPAKVRVAATATLRTVPAVQQAVEESTSVSQFENAIEGIVDGKQFQAYAATYSQYETKLCGTVTSTT